MKIMITEEQRSKLVTDHFLKILKVSWDRVFDNLIIKEDQSEGFEWVKPKIGNSKKTIPFRKNYWGMFWTIDCELYRKLTIHRKFLPITNDEFKDLLIIYLNEKYGHLFQNRLVKNIDDQCES